MHNTTLYSLLFKKTEKLQNVNNDVISVWKRNCYSVLCAIKECSCQSIEKKAVLDGQMVILHSSWVWRNSFVTACKMRDEEDRNVMFARQPGHKEV